MDGSGRGRDARGDEGLDEVVVGAYEAVRRKRGGEDVEWARAGRAGMVAGGSDAPGGRDAWGGGKATTKVFAESVESVWVS